MQTIRRVYLYLVVIVSLEVVVWGLINLLRSIFAGNILGGGEMMLASAISYILVGIPIFLFHWRWAENSTGEMVEEKYTRSRALCFYAILLATLIPVTQNLLAVFNKIFLDWFGFSSTKAMVGGNQTLLDNLIAIVTNLIVAGFFFKILNEYGKISQEIS